MDRPTWKTTVVFKAVLNWFHSENYMLVLEGGTSSSKTYSAIMALILISMYDAVPKLTSIVSETIPHIKGGAIRDFKDIMGGLFERNNWNETNRIYTFKSGSQIEFFSADDDRKMRGRRRDRLYINEANNITHEAAKQLMTRTRDRKFILDHNPVAEYWAHDYRKNTGVMWHHSTYLDAIHVLPKSTVDEIESRRNDANWWRIYGQGLIGMVEGRVFTEFDLIDEMPYYHTTLGMDFGFTNDPTAVVEYCIHNDDLYVNELLYASGMTNQDIGNALKKMGVSAKYLIYYDSAEPKSGEELRRQGFWTKPAAKGRDSILAGIDYIKRYRLKITKNSINLIKELRTLSYRQDNSGNFVNDISPGNDHAVDALRYAMSDRILPSGNIVSLRVKY